MLGKKNADTKMSTLIGAGAELTGDFTLDGSARIDGKIGGNVTVTGNLILGAGSIVTGDVQAASVLIGGPLLRARGLDNKFHLLADFGGAVLAGRERGTGRGYEFVTWIWDYERVGVSHGHYYEDDFAGAKRDFAVRSGLIPKASLFSNEELTEIYRATDHLLAEDPNLNDKQIRAIQEARIKIEFSIPDLDTQLEHRQDYSPQMEM